MKLFLNQWSTRAICTYGHTPPRPTVRTSVTPAEDTLQLLEIAHSDELLPRAGLTSREYGARHARRERSSGVDIRAIPHIEHVRRRHVPLARRFHESSRVRLERTNLGI